MLVKVIGQFAILASILIHLQANAGPLLVGSLLNDNQIIGPLDSITWTVRITNTGDSAFNYSWAGASGGSAVPGGSANYDNFGFHNADFPDFATNPLAASQVFDFDFFTMIPVSGGAAAGAYVSNNNFAMRFEDQTEVFFGKPSWTVVSRSVPTPATLALLGLGLAGLGCFRRKK